MVEGRQFSRVDTLKIRSKIEMKLGPLKAEKYFNLLGRYLSGNSEICKSEFDGLCIGIIGRENAHLHNYLIRSMLMNANLSSTPPPRKKNRLNGSLSVKVANGARSLQSLCKDFPQSPRRGRTPCHRERKCRDRPSPLGPHGKSHITAYEDAVLKVREQQSATELFSLGSRPPGSVEDGEEVDQAGQSPSIHSRSPVRAPLGISLNTKAIRKVPLTGLSSSYYTETCHNRGELPATSLLQKRLEQKLAMEGLKISEDCANLMNNSLDIFLKRLIKPCLEIAGARSRHIPFYQRQNCPPPRGLNSATVLDFRVAMELNPQNLGEDWPTQMERICSRASENVSGGTIHRR